MNVTLSLIAEFSDIPKEISHMLRYVEQELDTAASSAADLSVQVATPQSDEEVLDHGNEMMDLIHNLRLHMAKVDTRMEDCVSILRGYLHYIENPPEEEKEPQGEENEEG